MEMKEKDKTISMLQKRVSNNKIANITQVKINLIFIFQIQHLESLLSLKETRIQDLTSQLYKPERGELSFKNMKRSTEMNI